MASTFTAGGLADGTIDNTLETIFTGVASATYVKSFTVYNPNATQQTVKIYRTRSGGTDRRVRQYVLNQDESADVLEGGQAWTLGVGDLIRASGSPGDDLVEYYIDGVTEAVG